MKKQYLACSEVCEKIYIFWVKRGKSKSQKFMVDETPACQAQLLDKSLDVQICQWTQPKTWRRRSAMKSLPTTKEPQPRMVSSETELKCSISEVKPTFENQEEDVQFRNLVLQTILSAFFFKYPLWITGSQLTNEAKLSQLRSEPQKHRDCPLQQRWFLVWASGVTCVPVSNLKTQRMITEFWALEESLV